MYARTVVAVSIALLLTAIVSAGEMTAMDVVRKSNHVAYYQGKDGKAKVNMSIKDGKGGERTREFVILRRDEGDKDADDGSGDGDQKFYVYFSRPADVNKTVFLVHKHVGKDDDRWLYLPALDLVKRIAAGDKRTSFVGSHFFYEDVSGRAIDEDDHKLVETNDTYYIIESTPKKPGEVEFSKYKSWIHKGSFLPVQVEYYDKNGEVYRKMTAVKVEKADGFLTVTEGRMADLRDGGETVMTFSDIDYDVGLPEDIFTERYLRNPPRQHLR